MSEDARSLGTLAAAVAPGYMQTAAATPFKASIAGSWTGLTGRKQGRQQQGQILLRYYCNTVAECADSFLRISPTVHQFRKLHLCVSFLVYCVYSGQTWRCLEDFTGSWFTRG